MIADNPVLRRELLERWRRGRATAALTLYLTALAATLYGLYRLTLRFVGQPFGMDPSLAGPAMGRFLLESLLALTLVGVLFVVPAYAAGQIAGERERRTLPLLQATLLHSWQIVAGKLAASLAWMTLLVVATAPLAAATLFLGGVTPWDVLAGVGSVLVTMVGVGGLALGVSALARRTVTAVILTYLLVLGLVVGTGIAAGVSAFVRTGGGMRPITKPPVALYLNPFFGLADAASVANNFDGQNAIPSPLSLPAAALPDSPVYQEQLGLGDPDGEFLERRPVGGGAPPWLMTGVAYLLMGAAGFVVATRRLRSTSVRAVLGGTRRTQRRTRRGQLGETDAGSGGAYAPRSSGQGAS